MTINLYNLTEDKKVLDKTPTLIGTVDATPFEELSIITPKLIVSYDSTYINCNYIEIPIFNRFYYVEDKIINVGNRIIFNCKVDVLKSFKDDIKNANIVVIRNEGVGTPTEIIDNQLPVLPNQKTVEQVTVDDYNVTDSKLDSTGIYILQCIGGHINGG